MKKVLIMALAMLVVIASCKKKTDDPVTPTAAVTIEEVGGGEIVEVYEEITALANVGCTSTTIDNVKLYYTVEGSGEQTIEMVAGEYSFYENSFNYKAIIPAQEEVTTVTWYAIATEKGGLTAKSASITVSVNAPLQLDIVLNEISGISKYIELYNPMEEEIDISNYYLVKNDEADIIWAAVEGQKIAANGYLLLYSSKSEVVPEGYPEELIFKGGISPKKSLKVELFDEDAESIDAFTRGPEPWDTGVTEVDKAFARIPNSYGKWKLAAETPGTVNPETGYDIPQE